jgi:DNA-binding transcriptional MerR regulator
VGALTERGQYRITELAGLAGVTPRTVRYYVAEGLLPPPTGAGQRRLYGEEHLSRLLAIRDLKARYLPLGEIRRRLDAHAANPLADADRRGPEPNDSVGLVGDADPAGPEPSPGLARARLARERPIHRPEMSGRPVAPDRAAAGRPAPDVERPSIWRRLSLTPGVELQYDASGGSELEAAAADIAEYARRRLASRPTPHGHLGFRSPE